MPELKLDEVQLQNLYHGKEIDLDILENENNNSVVKLLTQNDKRFVGIGNISQGTKLKAEKLISFDYYQTTLAIKNS